MTTISEKRIMRIADDLEADGAYQAAKSVRALFNERKRLRDRVERLRELCSSAVGMLRDTGESDWSDILAAKIGDMEPTIDSAFHPYPVG